MGQKLRHNNIAWLLLPIIGLGILIWWQLNRFDQTPNLLTNPDFETEDLAGWQIVTVGQAQAVQKPAANKSGNTVVALSLPADPEESWVGIGQRLAVDPRQRYRLKTDYRLAYKGQSQAKVVLRVAQFDQEGTPIETKEISDPNPLVTSRAGETKRLAWSSLGDSFITAESAVAVEIGVGLVGNQPAVVEIDRVELINYPTPLRKIRQDRAALLAALLLVAFIGCGLSRILWPLKRETLIRVGLGVGSLILTIILVEIAVRFIPINLVSPNWPIGYHIPYHDGKSYRLAKGYPATYVTDKHGDRHLVMSNSLGVRDIKVPPPSKNQDLILVLGDSMTFGWAIDDINDTWPRRLDEEIEHFLPAPDRYHVINAGVSAYNSYQEVLLFQSLLDDMERKGIKPKFVLLSFFSGIWERNFYGPEGHFTVLNGVLMYDTVRDAILNLDQRLIEASPFDDLKMSETGWINEIHRFLVSKSRLYFILCLLIVNQFDDDWDALPENIDPVALNYKALQAFKEVTEGHDIQPVIAYLPAAKYFQPGRVDQGLEIARQLAALSGELDIPFLDPTENMKSQGISGDNPIEKLTLGYNRHYSPEGNALYAKALAPLVAEFLINAQNNGFTSSNPP